MVFEHLDSDLTDFMKGIKEREGRSLTELEIKVIIKQALLGLEYMNQKGYIHRDIKPENFVISSRTWEVKMIDFGTAKDINKSTGQLTGYVSTRWYRSPEQSLRSHNYGPESDIFAVGCVMAELFNEKPLFPGASELDQIETILKLLGTPKPEQWKEGYKLASARKVNLEKMQHKK